MSHPNDKIYKRIQPEDPVSSSDYIKQITDRYHIDLNSPIRHVISQWKDLAGSVSGSFSKCVGCSNGILDIVCTHPAYLQMVKMSKKEILKNINSAFPELKITDIRVHIEKN